MSIYGTPITASKNTIYVPGTNISIVNNQISAVDVVSTNAQSLSDTQKNQARANIAAVSSGDVSGMIQGVVKDVVSTNAQSLSDTQKNQARANIAAVSSGDVSGMIQGIVKVAGWDGSTLWLQG